MRRVLVTGSSGHLGEALMRTLSDRDIDAVGLDVRPSDWTHVVGSVADAPLAREVMAGVDVVLHTATLHKPQLAFQPRQAFVDWNISGTLALLNAAVEAGVDAFVMTSSTTVFGDALVPAPDEPAAWVDETVVPVPKNIYGTTKAAAEDLCQLAHRNDGLNCVVLRTSRFFPEIDDALDAHHGRSDENVKADEYAYRRVALEDVVTAHLLSAKRARFRAVRHLGHHPVPQGRFGGTANRRGRGVRPPRAAGCRGVGRTGLAIPSSSGPGLRQRQGQTRTELAARVRPGCRRGDTGCRRFRPQSVVTGGGLQGVRRQFVSPRHVRAEGSRLRSCTCP